MKNKWGILFVLFLINLAFTNGQAIAITQSLDDNYESSPTLSEKITFPSNAAIEEENVAYVPIWMLTGLLRLKMVVEPDTFTIQLSKGNKWLRFSMGNGTQQSQTVATSASAEEQPIRVINKENNVYVPMEFVADYFGYEGAISENQIQPKNQEIQPIVPIPLAAKKEQPKVAKPKVYLTFDDGPNEHLNSILDILKAKNAKGTFFMIEPQIRHYQEAVKRLVMEGHYPALHSVSHDKNKLYGGSPSNVVNEMEQTRKTLLEVTGIDSKLTRAPYGSKPFMTDSFRNALAAEGMKMSGLECGFDGLEVSAQ